MGLGSVLIRESVHLRGIFTVEGRYYAMNKSEIVWDRKCVHYCKGVHNKGMSTPRGSTVIKDQWVHIICFKHAHEQNICKR